MKPKKYIEKYELRPITEKAFNRYCKIYNK